MTVVPVAAVVAMGGCGGGGGGGGGGGAVEKAVVAMAAAAVVTSLTHILAPGPSPCPCMNLTSRLHTEHFAHSGNSPPYGSYSSSHSGIV